MIIVKNRLNAGWKFHQKGELEYAEDIYRSVVNEYPKRADGWIYFGMSLNDQARFDEALAAYDQALLIASDNESAWTNRGNTLSMLGRHQAALDSHRKALRISPQYARAHTNLGVQLLRMGEVEHGWQEYEWRTKTAVFSPPSCTLPFWHGQDLKNKHLLIHGEQGLGDEIQTSRYVSQVLEQGGKVSLAADSKLQPIFATSFPNENLVRRGDPLPAADYQICGLSLPAHFGCGNAAAYLALDSKKKNAWRSDLTRFEGLKIGISWTGNPQNPMNTMRSVPLREILAVLPSDKVSLISLQATHGAQDLDVLPAAANIYRPLERTTPNASPMPIEEMAALISCLDIVISCDSICAHLAPALGIETWLMTSKVPDWRWGIEGESSPWYRSVRLFRQQRQGDWRNVCEQLGQALRARLSSPSNFQSSTTKLEQPLDPKLAQSVERKACRHGVFYYLRTDKYIGESLRQYGEFSEQEVELFQQLLNPGETVIEVGSNIGTHSIPLGKIVGKSGQLLAFEPQRYVFDLLRLNVETNGLPQIKLNRMALGDTVGEITVPVLDPSKKNNFGGVPLGTQAKGDTVPVSTIDELSMRQCALIKADVEGMETAVIKGAMRTIERLQPILYLEDDREENSVELRHLIKTLGYKIYLHVPALYNPKNFFNNRHNIFGDIRSINILCLPKISPISVNGLREIH